MKNKMCLTSGIITGLLASPLLVFAQNYPNPLPNVNSFPGLISNLASAIVTLVLPLLVVAVIWLGFQFLVKSGNPAKLAEAKKMFFWVLLGGALAIGAATIAETAVNTLRNPGSGRVSISLPRIGFSGTSRPPSGGSTGIDDFDDEIEPPPPGPDDFDDENEPDLPPDPCEHFTPSPEQPTCDTPALGEDEFDESREPPRDSSQPRRKRFSLFSSEVIYRGGVSFTFDLSRLFVSNRTRTQSYSINRPPAAENCLATYPHVFLTGTVLTGEQLNPVCVKLADTYARLGRTSYENVGNIAISGDPATFHSILGISDVAATTTDIAALLGDNVLLIDGSRIESAEGNIFIHMLAHQKIEKEKTASSTLAAAISQLYDEARITRAFVTPRAENGDEFLPESIYAATASGTNPYPFTTPEPRAQMRRIYQWLRDRTFIPSVPPE